MRRGTGVFMPVYATVTPKRSESESRKVNLHDVGGQMERSRQTTCDSSTSTTGATAQATFAAPGSMRSLQVPGLYHVRDTTNNLNIPDAQLQPPTSLVLQHFPSPMPSTSSASDMDIMSAASDASFTSTCSSLLASTSPFTSPFAAVTLQQGCAPSHYGSCAHPNAAIQLATQGMPGCGSMAVHQPQALPQLTCQSGLAPLSSDLAELLLLEQQEAELDAAIEELVKLKQQLAAANQQQSRGVNRGAALEPQQTRVSTVTTLPISAVTTAAMIPGTSWATAASSPPSGYCQVLDAAAVQAHLQQQQALVGVQADMLQLLSIV